MRLMELGRTGVCLQEAVVWLGLPLGRRHLLTPGGPVTPERLSSDVGTDVVQKWLFPIFSKRQ